MTDARTRVSEMAMAVVLIAVAAAFLREGWHFEPGVFEPIGSGAVPNAVAWIVVALSSVMLLQAVLARPAEEPAEPERWRVAGLAAVLLALYVAALSLGVRYAWATLVFTFLMIVLLGHRSGRTLGGGAVAAGVLGFGLDYLFRHLLVTDLP